jgi:hypothetical protein
MFKYSHLRPINKSIKNGIAAPNNKGKPLPSCFKAFLRLDIGWDFFDIFAKR